MFYLLLLALINWKIIYRKVSLRHNQLDAKPGKTWEINTKAVLRKETNFKFSC